MYKWFPNVQRSDSIAPPNTMPENSESLWKWIEAFPNMGCYVATNGTLVSANAGVDKDDQEKKAPHKQVPPPSWYNENDAPKGKYLYFNDRNAPTRWDMTILTGDPFELAFTTETVQFNETYPTVTMQNRVEFVRSAQTTVNIKDENNNDVPTVVFLTTTVSGNAITFGRYTEDGIAIPNGAQIIVEYGYYTTNANDPLAVGTFLQPWSAACNAAQIDMNPDIFPSPIDGRLPQPLYGACNIEAGVIVFGGNGCLFVFDKTFGRTDYNADTGKAFSV
jgi:hypothetical protein